MKNKLLILFLFIVGQVLYAQQVSFVEYDLNNGLHVILHQDNSAPVVTTSVLYHVGSKDENPERTGFAHFFEHLLFEGTENIERGKWFDIVSSNGGSNNAYTTNDFTYYYEVFPSNSLELGLWMESERMLHPIINQVGIDTQNEVVKEEKRLRYDNRPYGKFLENVKKNLFKKHPYKETTIGKMEHLDAATLEEFMAFNKKYYIPNNAVLIVTGDINIDKTKKMIDDYFGPIPKSDSIQRVAILEDPITETVNAEVFDSNIQIPALITAYRTPSVRTRTSKVLDMISTYLSDGKSSKLYKKMVDKEKTALNVATLNFSQEDYGIYIIYGLPMGENSLATLEGEIDEEIEKIQQQLISERDYQKLQNKFEKNFVDSNTSMEGIANSLGQFYVFHGDTNLINSEIDIYRSITRNEIREVARRYLNPNQRVVVNYLPESSMSNSEKK